MQINFTLKQMEVLVALVELKNFTKAADRLFMTQPGVSVQLKNLEAQVGVKLIEKSGTNFITTDTGLGLYNHFIKILEDIEKAKAYINDVKGIITGELKIGMASSVQSIMISKLSPFMQLYPNIQFKLFVYERHELYQRLETGELDVIFASKLRDDYYYQVIDNIAVFAAVALHEDTSDYPDSVYALKQKHIILPDEGTNTRLMWSQEVLDNNFIIQSNSGHMVEEATSQGVGIGLVVEDAFKRNHLKKLNFKEFPQYLPLHIACLTNMHNTPTIRAIFSYFDNNMD